MNILTYYWTLSSTYRSYSVINIYALSVTSQHVPQLPVHMQCTTRVLHSIMYTVNCSTEHPKRLGL